MAIPTTTTPPAQPPFYVGISTKPLQIDNAANFVDTAENGALCLFAGRVRNHHLGRSVESIDYDVFPPLACQVFTELCQEAIAQFPGTHPPLRCYIEHFQGRLDIGGISVLIAVGSPHREAAFAACRYLIEELKTRAPIWKNEHYLEGHTAWVEGHSLCDPQPN